TGVEHVWSQVRQLDSSDTWVLPPLPWNTDVKSLAKLVHRQAPHAEVRIIAFSWGVGGAGVAFAKALKRVGIHVSHMICADGVGRTPWLPTWVPDPTSLWPWRRIVIPDNVGQVRWVRQRRR